ncbi:MAG: PilN domain-containing protein [Phycisphaeraceae bacterium]|nr:PilN domain-containing protein [Phycisphaeraceae bacterium]
MSNNASFLPEDYLAQKAELRTNVICMLLFVVVMFGVFLAFMWTNQRWTQVKSEQARINAEYQAAAEDIRMLQELEEQKTEMLHKAELAATIVERIPRSILLAEIINRMPDGLSLLEFNLASERVRAPVRRTEPEPAPAPRSRGGAASRRAPTRAEAVAQAPRRIEAPRFRTSIQMVGVAPTDLEVSRFLNELNGYPLLQDVALDYSEEQEIEGKLLRKFKIDMLLDTDGDIRSVEPLQVPRRLRDALHAQGPAGSSVVNAPTDTAAGRK